MTKTSTLCFRTHATAVIEIITVTRSAPHHHNEEHEGDWQKCVKCRSSFVTEDYVWYGTNEYNFDKLLDPTAYEPTKCAQCATVIRLSEDEYSKLGKEYFCSKCTDKRLTQIAKGTKK
jgi:hypothetical protein